MKKYSLVKICLLALCSAMFLGVLAPTASAATFSDVSNHWAASYIETCAGRGIVDGVGGGKFEPEGKVTNAQFVKMLCVAFFSDEEQTFENENHAAINTYFGGSVQWYAGKSYYFEKKGLLTNVDYNILSNASADQPMNRTNMAQVAANVLAQKGIAANEGDKALAQAKLTYVNDYYTISEDNRDAVKTCYALGIITGTDGGKFDGTNNMTRAQACTVITRLLDVVGKSPDPDPIVTPEPTATLANGKAITEENVLEILADIQTKWPTGTTWDDNTYNPNPLSSYVSSTLSSHGTSAQRACGGYASMVSDLIFGTTANPTRKLNSLSDVRPGDIILEFNNNGNISHVIVVIDTVKTGNRTGAIFYTDGNHGGKVKWPPNTTSAWNALMPDQLGVCIAYTRYPE